MSVSQIRSLVFYIGFAILVAHELDAVAQEEWRLLPLFDLLQDSTAYIVFVTLHVPLLAGLMWLTAHPSPRVQQRSRLAVDVLLVIHAVLHWHMSADALYSFHSNFSTALILGGAVAGLLHLQLSVRALDE